jgi:hypothetical protein
VKLIFRSLTLALLALTACDAAGPPASPGAAQASDDAATDGPCTFVPGQGAVCSGGDNGPGVTGVSTNNQGLIGDSMNGRGVYGSSFTSQGGYFSSQSGDGLLGYSETGFSGHFTGGTGVMIDPPMSASAGGPALTVNGQARFALPTAPAGVVPVCGVLDPASGLFTLTRCDDRLDRLEAEVAALEARLGSADAGAP